MTSSYDMYVWISCVEQKTDRNSEQLVPRHWRQVNALEHKPNMEETVNRLERDQCDAA